MAFRSREDLIAFRISDVRHRIFDGTGAYLRGARWTSPGRRVVYAAETYAGAMLEVLVHLALEPLASTHRWILIRIPAAVPVEEVSAEEIPGWNSRDMVASRKYGDQWHGEGRTAVLLVPSVATGGIERNVVINSEHPEFPKISAGESREVTWDARLFKS